MKFIMATLTQGLDIINSAKPQILAVSSVMSNQIVLSPTTGAFELVTFESLEPQCVPVTAFDVGQINLLALAHVKIKEKKQDKAKDSPQENTGHCPETLHSELSPPKGERKEKVCPPPITGGQNFSVLRWSVLA